jgi:hypothetical protein
MRTKILIALLLFYWCAKASAQVADMRLKVDSVKESILSRSPEARSFYRYSSTYRQFVHRTIADALSLLPPGDSLPPATTLASVFESRTEISESEWQNTTAVAVNRKDPNLIAVAAIDDQAWNHRLGLPVYVTDDGGKTWNTQRMPRQLHYETFGKPAITCDADGWFYCAYCEVSSSICIRVARSLDGYVWRPILVEGDTSNTYGNGEEDLDATFAVDLNPQSPHAGRVYIGWTRWDTAVSNQGIMLAWSDDHGAHWSMPTKIQNAANALGQLQVGADGQLFAIYEDFLRRQVVVTSSTDGGRTFSTHSDLGSLVLYPRVIQSNQFFTDTVFGLKGLHGVMVDPRVTLVIDNHNVLHAVYASWDSTHKCAQLIALSSSDRGVTWHDSLSIGRENAPYLDRFFPSISHDPVTDNTSLIYYSSEFDSANKNITVIRKTLGESGWQGNAQLDPGQFDPLFCSASFVTSIGDYIGCDENDGVFAAAWTIESTGPVVIIPGETNGHSDIMIYVSSPYAEVAMPTKVNADRLFLSAPFPNPAKAKATVNFTVPASAMTTLSLVSPSGQVIRTIFADYFQSGSYMRSLDLTGLSAGEYFLQLRSASGSVSTKLIVAQ